jgi:hypothetical protein
MKKYTIVISLLLLIISNSYCQQPFYGTVQYRVVGFKDDKLDEGKIDLQFNKGKYAITKLPKDLIGQKIAYIIMDLENKKTILLDTNNKKFYIPDTNDEDKQPFSFIKVDTAAKFMHFKKLQCYLLEKDDRDATYGWFADAFTMDCGIPNHCDKSKIPFIIDGHIPFIIEAYQDNKKVYSLYATDVNPSLVGDSSLFNYADYTQEKFSFFSETVTPKPQTFRMPPDTMVAPKAPMEEMMENPEQLQAIIEQVLKNMSPEERKKLEENMEKLKKAIKNIKPEDIKKVKEIMEAMQNKVPSTTQKKKAVKKT